MDSDRRQALGLAGAIIWLGSLDASPARACPLDQATGGTEIAPGVREIFRSSQEIRLARYKILWMTHLVFAPGAATPPDLVPNDVVVLLEPGLLRVRLDDQEFVLKGSGGIWAFPEGATRACHNTGADPAILRVIDLLPGL